MKGQYFLCDFEIASLLLHGLHQVVTIIFKTDKLYVFLFEEISKLDKERKGGDPHQKKKKNPY